MGKKLLFLFFTFSLFFLNPFEGFGQCPTSVSISANPGTTICTGTDVTFTANPTGGENLEYQWQINGSNVTNETKSTFSTDALTNGQKIRVVVTSTTDGACSKASNETTMTVKTVRTPTVSITSNKSSICPGENITFSANDTNGGSSPKYEWFINNSNSVSKTGESVTFSSTDFNEGNNTVSVKLTSDMECVTSSTAEATSEVFTLKPDATISTPTNKDQTVCIDKPLQNISFTIGGGGTGATISGLPPGVTGSFNSGTFTLNGTPTTAGVFDYTVTTTGTCAQTTATGTITVNPDATLSLSSGNSDQTVCAAGGVADANIDPITYAVGETGTGASVTGLPAGFTGSFDNGNFTISGSSSETGTHNYTVTATGSCGPSSALTGSITITENLIPSVSITSSDTDDEICEGTEVIFTATPTNGGSSPSYQWQINGSNEGTDSNTFTTSSLTDEQTVTVVMTSNETCITKSTATSNGITTTVNPNLEPSVSIETSDTEFCAGDEVTYSAIPVNGGTAPSYEWKVGSSVVGSGNVYTTSTLTDGQSITVTLTSNETCVTASTAVSDPVVVSVNENLVPSVTITSDDDNEIICSGSNITFTATPTNGGTNPEYQWQINGNASGGVTTSNTFSPAGLDNEDRVTAVLISSEECLAENDIVSNEISVQVDNSITGIDPVWDNSDTSYNPTAICPVVSGLLYKVEPIEGATSYEWTFPSGWSVTSGEGTNEVTVSAGSNATGGDVTVYGINECGNSSTVTLPVSTGTVAYASAGPDQTVCKGTNSVTLAGEIGGVIQNQNHWYWSVDVEGGTFSNDKKLDATYTIPASIRDNGGEIKITITTIKPSGDCPAQVDEMTITVLPDAAIDDPANKNQTVCIDTAISPITFAITGAGTGASVTGLPEGITGDFADGIYTLNGTPTQAGTFNYTVTTTGDCEDASISGTLTINDRPTFTQPTELFACVGESIPTVTFEGSSVAGTSYNWTNDNTAIGLAASGTGNINSFVATNTTNAPITANIVVTPVAETCEGTPHEFQITVYPEASVSKPENIVVCNSSSISEINFSGSNVEGTTYEWINDNVDIGLGASGTGDISAFTAVNNTSQPIVANITITPVANGCEGTAETFTVTVNPTTSFSQPEDIVVCNSESTSEVIFADSTVDGTTFSWTNDNPAIGLAESGTGNLPVFSATNPGTEPITANITVTPESNECEGTVQTFQITVNPTPTVTVPSTVVLCNGETFSGSALTGNVAGTTYSWSNSTTSIGLSETGTGDIPSFTAVNETEEPVTATISVIPSSNGCEGQQEDFQIIVNPSTIVVAGPDQTICSSGTATMAASLSGGASGGEWSSNGSGSFSDNTLTAVYTPGPTDAPNGSVILTFTTNDPEGPCSSASDSLELFINEEVAITTQPENIGICSTEQSELNVIASGDNLIYEWKRSDGANIVNSNGIYSSTLSFNNTTSANAGEYYAIVRGEDTCTEVESERVTINVDENIIIEEPVTEVPICGDGFSEVTMKFIAHANGSPLTFTWYKDNVKVDADSDENITITTGPPDENGKYEGTLLLENITTAYNGDYHVEINGPEEFTCSTAVTNPFQLRLNEIPEEPEVADIIYCQEDEAEPLTVVNGNNLTWYATETGDDAFDGTPTPSTVEFGETSYWVTQTPDVCESKRVEVRVIVKEKPVTPDVANIEYCIAEGNAPALTATAIEGATLNWYAMEDASNPLSSAPEHSLEEVGTFSYWVSQTVDGCESDLAQIDVIINVLPEVFISTENDITTICKGSSIILTGNGATSYEWKTEAGESVEGNSSATVSPEITTTYIVTGTDENGCSNTAEIIIEVDEPSEGGIATGPGSVCVDSSSGSLTLSEYLGEIQRWESSIDGGVSWTAINETTESLEFFDLTDETHFRAFVKNGVCEEAPSEVAVVEIDQLPIGGEINFEGFGRVLETCSNPGPDYNVPINLTGEVGEIAGWRYKESSDAGWSTIIQGGENFTGSTLTPEIIRSLGVNETTIFEVEIQSGACSPNVYSQSATLSIISSDIAPNPVTVTPGVLCVGELVTLTAGTGYGSGQFMEGGAFDNSSITNHGWRIRRDGSTEDLNFNSSADNERANLWLRTNPLNLATADIETNAISSLVWSSGAEDNKGFAVVSGDNPSTMETAVFNTFAMDKATLTFDQAYNLTEGDTIRVEISTDGGATYQTILYEESGPASSGNYNGFGTSTDPKNKIEIDLEEYLGRDNLRIRFHYLGKRDGTVWAVDAIDFPDGPTGVDMIWTDYTDPDNPIVIGSDTSEEWTPSLIGWNDFEIRTRLTFDSTGDACPVVENFSTISVFVFDQYTSTATAQAGSCGSENVQLSATLLNSTEDEIESFPTRDGYTASWEVIEGPDGYELNATHFSGGVNDPNAIFTPDIEGTYTLRWTINRSDDDIKNESCPPVYTDATFVVQECKALDFDGEDDYVDLGNSYQGSNYSIEAWIRPFNRELEAGGQTDATNGTIISGPGFEIKMDDLPASITNERWYHIAYTSDNKLYIDGILQSSNSISGVGGNHTLIGARWNDSSKTSENHFSGWIEEVRIWSTAITQDQIRFMMNQRLQAGANIGEQIPMPAPGGIDFTLLAGYYRLISAEPDPANLVNFAAELLPANGVTPNLANADIPGRLINMETNQQNTAPLPYFSANDGLWATDGTWARPEVWDPPHTGEIEWNIVKTSNDIQSGARDIKVLGLISESEELNIDDSGQLLHITHYLKLAGVIDLDGESQLIQDPGGILDEDSPGYLDRDQQGTQNSYNYNYWSSPVSTRGSANNGGYTIGSVLVNPKGQIEYKNNAYAADATGLDPTDIIISSYWLHTFKPGEANEYEEWDKILETGTLNSGEGFTMKGTSGVAELSRPQNYTFRGKPHNGDFTLNIGKDQNYLIGNPFPSAIDSEQFILDNIEENGNNDENVFNGAIYFWHHFGQEDSHILLDYVGGYATRNLLDGVPAASIDYRINDNNSGGGVSPEKYIPVGQSFLINSVLHEDISRGYDITGGDINFKNSQRIFKKEGDESVFLKPEKNVKSTKEPEVEKIRISYRSPKGFTRQILVGAHPATTNGFDLGYDAPLIEYNAEDMYWIQESNWLVIQGVPDFDKGQKLPLGVVLEEEGEFTIKIDKLENIAKDKNVYLRDILNDSIHDLRKDPYVSTSEAGYIHDRFEIIFYYEEELPSDGGGEVVDAIELDVKHAHVGRELQILNPDQIPISNLYIFDINGNQLQDYDEISNDKEVRLPVRNYSSGVYIIKLYAEGKIISKKIIIQR